MIKLQNYINGKLVGAYAYGYSWPKEQAIILVTPIEDMIELIDTYPIEPPAPNHRPTIKRSTVSENRRGTNQCRFRMRDQKSELPFL